MSGGSKSQVVGHKYYAGIHFVLGYGPFDKIVDMQYADRECWVGEEAGDPNGYGQIIVDAPGLLGGKKREGGISGTLDVGMGYATQPVNDYLKANIGKGLVEVGSDNEIIQAVIDGLKAAKGASTDDEAAEYLVPAYRGVVSLIARQMYWGNNPYLKAVNWLCQRIHVRSDGSQQWYDEKAEIPDPGGTNYYLPFAEGFDNGLADFSVSPITPGANFSDFTIVADTYGNCVELGNATGVAHERIEKDVSSYTSSKTVFKVECKMKLVSLDSDDCGILSLRDSNRADILNFQIARQAATDSLRRPRVGGAFFGSGPLTPGEWYLAVVETTDGVTTATITHIDTGEVFDSKVVSTPDFSDFTYIELEIDGGLSAGVGRFDDIRLNGYAVSGDMNPSHIVREIRTDNVWGAGLPETEMGPSYTAAADLFWNERLGLSFIFADEIEYKDMIAEVQRHVDAVCYEDPDTGLQEIKPIRDDDDLETLPVLDPSKSTLEQWTKPENFELVNQVVIEYWNRAENRDTSLTLQDTAAVNMVGGIISQTMNYPGICRDDVALMVGQRDLARFSRPWHKGRLVTNRKVANLMPGDRFKLTDPSHGLTEIVCRVAKRTEQGLLSGELVLEIGEDIFGAGYGTYTVPMPPGRVDPVGAPKDFSHQTAFEVPYYLLVQQLGETAIQQLSSASAFFGFAGTRPGAGAHINYNLYDYPDGTGPETEFSETAEFTPFAVVTADAGPLDLTLSIQNLTDEDSIRPGHLIFAGDGADASREVMALDVAVAEGDTAVTVKRGLIDTLPRDIPAGTVLYFVETWFGYSETEYAAGETVEGYGAPVNGRGQFEGPYTYHDVLMTGRFFKPYPPGNFRVDGISYPDPWYSPPAQQVVLDWNYRDRVIQSDQTVDHFDVTDYGPEAGTTYRVEADAYDSDDAPLQANWLSSDVGLVKTYTLDLDATPPPANTARIVVRVWAVRDAEDSLQAATSSFLYQQATIADEGTALPILDVDGNYIVENR